MTALEHIDYHVDTNDPLDLLRLPLIVLIGLTVSSSTAAAGFLDKTPARGERADRRKRYGLT